MSDFVKSASNLSKNYDRMVSKNNSVRIGVLGILILYCVLVVPMLSLENLRFLENNVARIVLILVISLLCLLDPVLSIILAICFVVTLHRLNVLRNKAVVVNNSEVRNIVNNSNNIVNNNNNNANNVANNNDGLLNDSDLDSNNNVVNNNNVNNVPVNNAPVNNAVVNNSLLNNAVSVNNNNPNNLDYLNDNMNVLTDTDNSAANVVNVNERHSRNIQNNIGGLSEVENAGVIGNHLLMDDTDGYNLNNTNKLRGPYRNNVMPDNSSGLRGGPFTAVNSNDNVNQTNNNQQINNFQVNSYNSNNLITKNPFPGQNTNFQVEPQRAELNVPGFNHDEPEQLVINNNNNTVEQLSVNIPNNAEGFHGHVNEHARHKEHFIVPNKEEFNDNNGLNSLNNIVNLASNNNSNVNGTLNNVLNNAEQQLVGNNNQVAINNIMKNNVANNLENVPQNLLFTSSDQLQSAQDRSVYCEGTKNNQPILSADGSHSAQGYNLPGDVNGFNQYGAEAINYLCVSDNC
jgi:hypothetical protein